MNETKVNTSTKVLDALKDRGSSKLWLAQRMEISPPTLYSRLKYNDWSIAELLLLEKLLQIK